MYIWNKIYYILIKKGGDNCDDYFIGNKRYCLIHKVFSCKDVKCLEDTDSKLIFSTADSFIKCFTICSTIYMHEKNKFKYFDSKVKLIYLNDCGYSRSLN